LAPPVIAPPAGWLPPAPPVARLPPVLVAPPVPELPPPAELPPVLVLPPAPEFPPKPVLPPVPDTAPEPVPPDAVTPPVPLPVPPDPLGPELLDEVEQPASTATTNHDKVLMFPTPVRVPEDLIGFQPRFPSLLKDRIDVHRDLSGIPLATTTSQTRLGIASRTWSLLRIIGDPWRSQATPATDQDVWDFGGGKCTTAVYEDLPHFCVRNSGSAGIMEESVRREGWLADQGSGHRTSLGSP